MSFVNSRELNFSSTRQVRYINPAGFWLRLFAFIYDSVIAGVITTLAFTGLFLLVGNTFKSFFYNFLNINLSNATDLSQFFVSHGFMFLAIYSLLPIIINAFYYSVFESSKLQATPGKLLLGITVTSDMLSPLKFGQALKRNILRHLHILILIAGLSLILISLSDGRVSILSSIILLIATLACPLIFFVGHLMSAFTENKQALHDKLSDCLVIKNEDAPNIQRFFFSVLAVSLIIGCSVINYYNHGNNYKYSNKMKYSYHSMSVNK